MDKKDFQKAIKKEFADKFIDKYKEYGITTKTEYWCENDTNHEGIYLIIKNPHGEDIRIMYDGNYVPNEMIFFIAHYHTHFSHFYEMYSPGEKEENFIDYVDYYVKNISRVTDKILQGKDLEKAFNEP